MPEKYSFGIVGCGAIAAKHAEALGHIEEAHLAMLCDQDEERARHLSARCGGAVCKDYRQLLDDPAIDAVIVATPSGMHARMGSEALQAGKHVLIEKPLALSGAEAENLIERAQEVGRCLGTVHPNRMYHTSKMVNEAVKGNRLGRLSHAVVTLRWNRPQAYYEEAPWRKLQAMDGGILFNQAWHALDLLLWFMGPVLEAHGQAAARLHEIETEDVALLAMRFESGALGLVEATTNVYPRNLEQTVAVFGGRGSIILGGGRIDAIRLWRVQGEDEAEILARWGEETAPRLPGSWAHEQVIRNFIDQIDGGKIVGAEVCGALAGIMVCEGIKNSR